MSGVTLLATESSDSNYFDRQCRIEGWDQQKLAGAKVLVVGCGAIGNEVLKNLALLGFANIFVADFDRIEDSNLSRTVLFRRDDLRRTKAKVAAERTQELCLAEGARVRWFDGDVVWKLGTGVFEQVDIVLGCLDNLEARLAVNRQCNLARVPWVDAGILGLTGQVVAFEPGGACYRCGVSGRRLNERSQGYSCDDFKRRVAAGGLLPTVQVTSALVAALQVQEAAKILCGMAVEFGVRHYFVGDHNELMTLKMNRSESCPVHLQYEDVRPLALTHEASLGELLDAVAELQGGSDVGLDLSADSGFVSRARCRSCGEWVELRRPRFAIYAADLRCKSCATRGREDSHPETPTEVEEHFVFRRGETPSWLLEMSLAEVGVAYLAVIAVVSQSGDHTFYQLSGKLEDVFALPATAAIDTEEINNG